MAITFADNLKIVSKRRKHPDRLSTKERNFYEKIDWNVS